MTWDDLVQKHAQLTLREKLLILISGLAIIWLISLSVILEAQYKSWQQQVNLGQTSRNTIIQTQAQIKDIESELNKEMNNALKQQIGLLKIKHKKISERLTDKELALVSKSEMAQTLKSLLRENRQLKLMSFQSLAPQSILLGAVKDNDRANDKDKQHSEPLLYKHVIVVEIEGSYFSILKFLQQIEQSSDKILWQAVNYTVSEYPKADAMIEVFTLSTDEEFISVNH